MRSSTSLRNPINAKCCDCIHDDLAKGNWRQQVTLCSSYGCPLWEVRPLSRAPIPESVLNYYGVESDDRCLRGRNGYPASRSSETSDDANKRSALNKGGVTSAQESVEAISEGTLSADSAV